MNKLLTIMVVAAAGIATAGQKVAVFDFSTAAAAQTQSAGADLGHSIRTQVESQLSKRGVVLVDRGEMDTTRRELALGRYGEGFDRGTQVQFGKRVAASKIIVGSVDSFLVDMNGADVAVPFIGGVGLKLTTVQVVATARLIDVATNTVITFTGIGHETQRRLRAGGGPIVVGSGGQVVGGAARKALEEAADSLAKQIQVALTAAPPAATVSDATLDGSQPAIIAPAAAPYMRAYRVVVANVDGKTVYLSGGDAAGLKKGDRLEIRRVLGPITDPATGQTIGWKTSEVEVVTVNEVQEQLAIAEAADVSKAVPGNVAVPRTARVASTYAAGR